MRRQDALCRRPANAARRDRGALEAAAPAGETEGRVARRARIKAEAKRDRQLRGEFSVPDGYEEYFGQ